MKTVPAAAVATGTKDDPIDIDDGGEVPRGCACATALHTLPPRISAYGAGAKYPPLRYCQTCDTLFSVYYSEYVPI